MGGKVTTSPKRLSKKIRHKLVVDNMFLVKHIVNKLVPHVPINCDINDLYSAAMIGLINASNRFNTEKDCSFETFAKYYIRGAVLDELRMYDVLSRVMRDKVKKIDKSIEKLEHQYGRKPTEEEIACDLDVSIDSYLSTLAAVTIYPSISIEEHKEDSNGNIICVGDLLTDNSKDPSELLETGILLDKLMCSIRALPYINRLYILLYYGEDLTLKEIGSLFNLHESRISQLISISINSIKEYISQT